MFRACILLVMIWMAPPVSGGQDLNGKHASPADPFRADPPVFSHDGGPYSDPFSLVLDAGEGASVYFTTDGSVPDSTAAAYSGPIPVDGTVMVRAVAYRPGSAPSDVVTGTYARLSESVRQFDSNLPLVILHQFSTPITPGSRTPAYFTVFDTDGEGRARLDSDAELQSHVMANIRGSSSQQFPKKMFGIHLVDDEGSNRNEPLLGMPAEHNWILYAPYSDKTLMRNVVAYTLGSDLGRYAPRTRFVELFLHSGSGPVTEAHYHGVYVLVERIKWDNNRVDITKITPEDNAEPEITGGYILKKDRLNLGETGLSTARGTHLAYVRPNESTITPQQKQWLIQYLNRFEAALFGPGFTDPENGYAAIIDVDSFIDFHLITELCKEIDGYRLSTFMHKDRSGKLTMGPIWDYNLSLGNANYLEGWIPQGWYYPLISHADYLHGWYTRLFQDPEFAMRYAYRWWQLRRGPFSNEHIIGLIREQAELLEEAQERNFRRWPVLGIYVWPNHFIGQSFRDEVEWMIRWVEDRLAWIDGELSVLPETAPMHYWHFDHTLANDTPFESLEASFGMVGGGMLEFRSALEGYPFEPGHPAWRKASMERRNRPTPLNYRPDGNYGIPYDTDAMRGLQVRQPFAGDGGENTLIFHLPTGGYAPRAFSFAAMDEDASLDLAIDYSTDPEAAWVTTGLAAADLPLDAAYQLFEVDLTGIDGAEDNPHFRIRIRFTGGDLHVDEGSRVTFNNISLEGEPTPVDVSDPHSAPEAVVLEQNYPNPFNSVTVIRYEIPEAGPVELSVYNVLGQLVAAVLSGEHAAGRHEAVFDASGLASGVYVYRLRVGDRTEARQLVVLRP